MMEGEGKSLNGTIACQHNGNSELEGRDSLNSERASSKYLLVMKGNARRQKLLHQFVDCEARPEQSCVYY